MVPLARRADESDLWPDAGGPLTTRTRPEELGTVYPHRWSIPREVWTRFFASAEHEIGILVYSALFLEDAGILDMLAEKGGGGVKVRITLGDEGIGDAMPAKIRNALTLYRSVLARGERRDPVAPERSVQLDLSC